MNWNPRIEGMPAGDLDRLQYRLAKTLAYRLYAFSPLYHERMREANVHPDEIRSLEDVRKLPFMYKRDLRDTYPTGLFTVPREELVRYHVSSGTTGKPTVVGYTEKDIENWTESLARAFTSIGLGRGDVIQVSYGYGLFTGGLGAHYGAERIGATVLPTSVGNTERQVELDAGPRCDRDRLHAIVPPPHRRSSGADGDQPGARYRAPDRHPRGRALVRADAAAHPGVARDQGL